MPDSVAITPAQGKLGVLTPGMGAVATTLYAGVLAARYGRDPGTYEYQMLLGIRPDTCHALITASRLVVRFGPWTVRSPRGVAMYQWYQ